MGFIFFMALSRHLSREIAFQMLFAWDARHNNFDDQQILKDTAEYVKEFYKGQELPGFLKELIEGTIIYTKEIKNILEINAPEWPLEKINPIDRAILFLGIYEVLFQKEVPPVVAIDEAIELAKKYGNESSGKFINGVLNTVMGNKKKILEKYNV